MEGKVEPRNRLQVINANYVNVPDLRVQVSTSSKTSRRAFLLNLTQLMSKLPLLSHLTSDPELIPYLTSVLKTSEL